MTHGCLFSGYLGQESVDVVYLLKKKQPLASLIDLFLLILLFSALIYFISYCLMYWV